MYSSDPTFTPISTGCACTPQIQHSHQFLLAVHVLLRSNIHTNFYWLCMHSSDPTFTPISTGCACTPQIQHSHQFLLAVHALLRSNIHTNFYWLCMHSSDPTFTPISTGCVCSLLLRSRIQYIQQSSHLHGWEIAVILRNFRKTKLSKSI